MSNDTQKIEAMKTVYAIILNGSFLRQAFEKKEDAFMSIRISYSMALEKLKEDWISVVEIQVVEDKEFRGFDVLNNPDHL
jgi:hypothetical protein